MATEVFCKGLVNSKQTVLTDGLQGIGKKVKLVDFNGSTKAMQHIFFVQI